MPENSQAKPDRNLALELVRVTEAAALAAARWVGRGDNIRADDAAVLAGCVRLLDRHRDRLVLDPSMLADTAATASHRALRLGRTAEARRLALLAARTRPTHLRHWARVGALAVPSVARRRALRAHGVPTSGGPCDRVSSP